MIISFSSKIYFKLFKLWLECRVFVFNIVESKEEHLFLFRVGRIFEDWLRIAIRIFLEIRWFWNLNIQRWNFVRFQSNQVICYADDFFFSTGIIIIVVVIDSCRIICCDCNPSENHNIWFNLNRSREKCARIIQCLNLHPLVICWNVKLSLIFRHYNLISLFSWISRSILVKENSTIFDNNFILPAADC